MAAVLQQLCDQTISGDLPPLIRDSLGRPECESRSDTASQKRLNCSVALPEQKYGR